MVFYTTKSLFNSAIAPGVSYTIRKISHKRRMELNSSASKIFQKIDDLQRQLSPIQEEIEKAEAAARIEPCSCSHEPLVMEKEGDPPQHDEVSGRCRVRGCGCRKPQPDEAVGGYEQKLKIQSEILDVVINDLYPAYIRWGVADIQGLKIDDQPATVDSLLSDGPEPLIAELGEEIQRVIKLSPEEVLAFPLPTTSDVQVDGTIGATTAPSANLNSSTSDETATASSPS